MTNPGSQHAPRVRRTGVMVVVAMVAAALVTLFAPATASAAPQTVTFQEGVNGYAGTTDTTLDEANPAANRGGDDGIEIFGMIDTTPLENVRGLIKFDLSSVPQGSTVTAASITFTLADNGQDVTAHKMNRAWSEGQATWTDAAIGTPWATAGAEGVTDRDAAALGDPIAAGGAVGSTTTLTLPVGTVEGWVDDPSTNHGVALLSVDDNDGVDFYSSERFDTAQRPVFSITFEAPEALVITTASPLTNGMVDSAYSTTLAATGGTSPYTWAIDSGSLPAGLSMSAGGAITGTPTTDGVSNFTVEVTDTYGVTADKAFSLTIDPLPDDGGAFVGMTPNRVLNTRNQGPCVSGAAGRTITVAPSTGVPADAEAVSLNVTVADPTAPGYLTVYPTGSARPTASNLNYVKGQVVPNRVTTKVGTSGRITLFASGGCPNVIVDVAGYFTGGDTGSGAFVGVTPFRALNTRNQGPCVSGNAGRELTVAPLAGAGVPADASAVALNVTVADPAAPGYVTVYPTGAARPTASNLNYVKGQVVPNHVTTKVGTGGKITIYASGGCPNVIVDVAGYFTAGATSPGGFVGVTPFRALNTRNQGPCVSGAAGRELTVAPLAGAGVPADASAVVLNVTVADPAAPGYVTVYPTGSARPTASNLNYVKGQVVPNAVATKVGTGGKITIYASGGCPNVIVDVVGYHTATVT